MRYVAFFFLAATVWIPAIYWPRMSPTQRYLAVFALGAALVFYLYHPTPNPTEGGALGGY